MDADVGWLEIGGQVRRTGDLRCIRGRGLYHAPSGRPRQNWADHRAGRQGPDRKMSDQRETQLVKAAGIKVN